MLALWPRPQDALRSMFPRHTFRHHIDELVGGETRLWSASGESHVDVTPAKGRALFFRRGSPDAVLHAGLPVSGDVPKYMALINLAYETE